MFEKRRCEIVAGARGTEDKNGLGIKVGSPGSTEISLQILVINLK